MTYYADLTEYDYCSKPVVSECYNIGWLDNTMPFEKGDVPNDFLEALLEYYKVPVIETRGVHYCNLCDPEEVITHKLHNGQLLLGTSEIRIFTEKRIFAAPTLIYHYITEHNYLPPDCFIDAVLESRKMAKDEYFKILEYWGYK